VTATRLQLEFDGFTDHKWGADQRAQAGDWLVERDGETHTVAADSIARAYRAFGPGRWLKSTPVLAEAATQDGGEATKEGRMHFKVGD